MSDSGPLGDGTRVLSRQGGATVLNLDDNIIHKSGRRVRYNEEVAMRLVKQNTNVPVPDVLFSSYSLTGGGLAMTIIPGSSLELLWNGLDDYTKQRVCHEIWNIIAKLRQIPKPSELSRLFQCSADGSPTDDVLIQDLRDTPVPILDDIALRARIEQRYFHFYGRRYTKELPHMLPRSNVSVFTHGDIAPRNIMVDQDCHITGILDWEAAGWYPDYWEYANIMRPSVDNNWRAWMDRTAPQKWDLAGINAARRVLF